MDSLALRYRKCTQKLCTIGPVLNEIMGNLLKSFSCFFSIRPRGYKTIFMSLVNSAEHEILNGHSITILKNDLFSGSDKPRMLFFPAHK